MRCCALAFLFSFSHYLYRFSFTCDFVDLDYWFSVIVLSTY